MKKLLTALAYHMAEGHRVAAAMVCAAMTAAMTQTVSAGDTALQPVLHYRADTGVTLDGNNKVTGWKNLGSLGSAGWSPCLCRRRR